MTAGSCSWRSVRTDDLFRTPEFLDLPACPFYRVEINGSKGMEGLAKRYADKDPTRAYVEATLNYDSVEDNTLTIERELKRMFPRMYRLHLQPVGEGVQVAHPGENHDDVAIRNDPDRSAARRPV